MSLVDPSCFLGLSREERRQQIYEALSIRTGTGDPDAFLCLSPEGQEQAMYVSLGSGCGSGVNAAWDAPATGPAPDGYRVYYGTDGILFPNMVEVGPDVFTVNICNLIDGQEYCFYVVAFNGDGESAPTATECAIAGTQPGGGGEPVLLNGGFEAYTGTADDGVTDAFTGWGVDVQASGYVDASSLFGGAHGGAVGAKCRNVGGSSGVGQAITVTPSTNYRLTFWTRGDGVEAGVYYIYDITNLGFIIGSTTTGVGGTTYALVTQDFTSPAGCVSLGVNLYSPPGNGTNAWFDDVALVLN